MGAELPVHRTEITPRMALAYAAGIGARDPVHLDDAAGIAAPPPFCVSLEWPVVSAPEGMAKLGLEPAEARRGVHASQDSRFHRPVRPGMCVVTRGRLVEARATRAGALAVLRLDTLLEGSGEPLVTSFAAFLYRGVGLDGADRRIDGAREPSAPGDAGTTRRDALPIPRELPHIYTECARIWNPIHTERRVALAAGLPDIILHGTATWALAGQHLVAAHAGGDATRLARLRGRFRAMVVPGAEIAMEHAATGGGVRFEVRNADGEPAIGDGFAELRALPG